MVLFECCADSIESCVQAELAGAGRIELCDGLVDGGVTPSHGKIALATKSVKIPVNVLIRPRGGDFCYSDIEVEIMKLDIHHCKILGVAGVVIGILLPDGSVDRDRMQELIDIARPMTVTFHKAIDVSRNPIAALLDCATLEIDVVLTSGGAATVLDGAETIKSMVDLVNQTGSRTRILAGGGVTAANARELIERTGVHEVHGSGALTTSSMIITPTVASSAVTFPSAEVQRRQSVQLPRSSLKFRPYLLQSCRPRFYRREDAFPQGSARLHGRREGEPEHTRAADSLLQACDRFRSNTSACTRTR